MSFFVEIQKYIPQFTQAFFVTIELAVVSLILATILGILVGLVTASKSKSPIMKVLKFICKLYVDLIRGTPMLVQILIIYYGFSQALKPLGFAWLNIGGEFTAGVVILMLNAGAYMSEIVRGGIESVDKGQIEASMSLGLSYGKTMRKIVLPQAIRTMLPSIINQYIISIKDTSLLSFIGLAELTNTGKTIVSNWPSATLQLYCFMALYYLFICFVLSKLSGLVERKFNYGR